MLHLACTGRSSRGRSLSSEGAGARGNVDRRRPYPHFSSFSSSRFERRRVLRLRMSTLLVALPYRMEYATPAERFDESMSRWLLRCVEWSSEDLFRGTPFLPSPASRSSVSLAAPRRWDATSILAQPRQRQRPTTATQSEDEVQKKRGSRRKVERRSRPSYRLPLVDRAVPYSRATLDERVKQQ
jgi:hypothetical protein